MKGAYFYKPTRKLMTPPLLATIMNISDKPVKSSCYVSIRMGLNFLGFWGNGSMVFPYNKTER
jgi:hypothetical protein